MTKKFTKVISVFSFVDEKFSFTQGQVYEIDSAIAKEYIKIKFMIPYDNSMFDNPNLPVLINTNVIHVD